MEFANIIEFIQDTGFAIVLMAYFLIKDWKFNQSILDVLTGVREVLTKLETWHTMEEKK